MNIIEKYFNSQEFIQNDFVRYKKKRHTKYKHKNPLTENELNHLFICPVCNRVWSRYRHPGAGIELMYLDKSFPKRQDKMICPECKQKEIK